MHAIVENPDRPPRDPAVGAHFTPVSAGARLVLAIGDQARERVALDALSATATDGTSSFRVVRRCVTIHDLHAVLAQADVDIALVGADLHGLRVDQLRALCHGQVPLVIWGSGPALAQPDESHPGQRVIVVPRDASPDELRDALASALRAPRARRSFSGRAPVGSALPADSAATLEAQIVHASGMSVQHRAVQTRGPGALLAVVGVSGGVGCSTVAAGLAGGLANRAETALVDLDTVRPSLAVALDLNPARNLAMVVQGTPRDDSEASLALLQGELQALDPGCPRGVALAGVPRPGTALAQERIEDLLRQLRMRQRYVVADLGAYLEPSTDAAAVQRAALAYSDRVLVVASSDIVGLRRAAALLKHLRPLLVDGGEHIALVLNRHDGRYHHDAAEVAEVLGTGVAAAIPDDSDRVQRALVARRLVTAESANKRGSAVRALLELAEHVAALAPDDNTSGDHRDRRYPHWLLRMIGRGPTDGRDRS
jgi:MinD-like ATPase involved in chromosome partitioning or flagellar assembly